MKPRADDRGLLLRYDRVRSFAHLIQREIKSNPGGDAYVYTGSMDLVEALRESLDDLEGYVIENDLDIRGDDLEEE